MPDSKDLKDLDSQLKKTIISAESFKRGSSVDFSKGIQKTTIGLAGYVRQLVNVVSDLGKIVNNNSRKITSLKNISKTQSSRISGENIGAKLPGSSTSNVEDSIATITKSVTSIAEILAGRKKTLDNAAAFDRRKAEQEKRGLAEDKLEKRFEGLKSEAEKVIAPIKSILDKIIDFFVTVFLGRVVYKLLEWFGDPKNADKVRSIGRFLGDHWPKLLALYITFGTSFGRFALGLTKVVARGAVSLLSKILLLSKAKKLRAAGKFLGGGKGRGLAGVLGTGVALGGAYAVTQGLKGDGEDQKTQGLAGGGFVIPKIPRFSGGGLNFKGMLGGMFAKPQEMSSGFVSGEKGVDKVPAMLSDGEFVMSAGAVQKYGVDTLEAMNASGGGTNKPKIMSGMTYAAGGGLVGGGIGGYDVDKFAGSSGYYIGEILKGLAPQFGWANDLARQAGISAQKAISQSASSLQDTITKSASSAYSGFMNKGAEMHGYLTRGGMQNDLTNLGNQALTSLQSNFNTVRDVARNASDSVSKLGTGKKYKMMAENNERKSQEAISKYDAWIQSLPKGFLKDTMNRGLIPIPTGNSFGMTGLTYIKAMMGPLGRPFKILSNESVDKARQEIIDMTAAKNGLRVGADGKMSMEWNRHDRTGSGAYTDDLKSLGGASGFGGGKLFNSTFGRFSATQKGDRLVTNDVYNFNSSVGTYASDVAKEFSKGNINEGLYKMLSMTAKFAEDIGWLNQRALGSEIDIGSVKNIDPKTGKPKVPSKSKSPVIPNKSFYGPGGDPTGTGRGQAQQAQIPRSKPKNVRGVRPSTAPKPKVVYGPPAPKKRNVRGGRASTKTPSFSATTNGMRSKQETLGLMR